MTSSILLISCFFHQTYHNLNAEIRDRRPASNVGGHAQNWQEIKVGARGRLMGKLWRTPRGGKINLATTNEPILRMLLWACARSARSWKSFVSGGNLRWERGMRDHTAGGIRETTSVTGNFVLYVTSVKSMSVRRSALLVIQCIHPGWRRAESALPLRVRSFEIHLSNDAASFRWRNTTVSSVYGFRLNTEFID